METDAYRKAMPAHLEESLGYLGDERAVIRCAATLAPQLRELVGERGGLEVKVDPNVSSGFRLVTNDHRVEIDNSLTGRLERLWPLISVSLASRTGSQQ